MQRRTEGETLCITSAAGAGALREVEDGIGWLVGKSNAGPGKGKKGDRHIVNGLSRVL